MADPVLDKNGSHLSRAAVLTTKAIGDDKIEAKVVLRAGAVKSPISVLADGYMESLAKLFTNKLASIEHPIGIQQGR